jgi:Family of unknown function (DUF5519)
MAVQGAHEMITQAVTSWPDITAHPHRFGGTEYRLGERREIGHIHGDELVDIPFPVKVRDALIAAGRAELHHLFPKMGAVSFWLRESEDIQRAIELLRESYELALKQRARRTPTVEP